ncbi:MAG: cupin domain-containing protein [Leptolyngbyaceae cyanobacterium bins.349]|nr:cupin domain-containing protein [Leptolyngbyaceae cyanobacterium bins.349]
MKNIFQALPEDLSAEVFEAIAESNTVKIERIVSQGHTTPTDEWYDQDCQEWVIVLQGEAALTFESGDTVHLTPGCYLNIAAHQRHRVTWTDPTQVTIWLAVHY